MKHISEITIKLKGQEKEIKLTNVVGYNVVANGKFYYFEVGGTPKPKDAFNPFGSFDFDAKWFYIDNIEKMEGTIKTIFSSDEEKLKFIEKEILGRDMPVTPQKRDVLKEAKDIKPNETNTPKP
jgi:hypothetical protein